MGIASARLTEKLNFSKYMSINQGTYVEPIHKYIFHECEAYQQAGVISFIESIFY